MWKAREDMPTTSLVGVMETAKTLEGRGIMAGGEVGDFD